MAGTLKRLVRTTARKVLAALEKLPDVGADQETELVVLPPWKVTIQARRMRAAGDVKASGERPDWIDGERWASLGEIGRNVVLAATTAPVPAKVLARLAGYKPSSYFRQAVTELVRAGILRRTADGLALSQ